MDFMLREMFERVTKLHDTLQKFSQFQDFLTFIYKLAITRKIFAIN